MGSEKGFEDVDRPFIVILPKVIHCQICDENLVTRQILQCELKRFSLFREVIGKSCLRPPNHRVLKGTCGGPEFFEGRQLILCFFGSSLIREPGNQPYTWGDECGIQFNGTIENLFNSRHVPEDEIAGLKESTDGGRVLKPG